MKPDEVGQMFRRFSTFDIVIHFTMMVTFIGLVLTGIPLKFSHAPWASGLMHFLGGATMAGLDPSHLCCHHFRLFRRHPWLYLLLSLL